MRDRVLAPLHSASLSESECETLRRNTHDQLTELATPIVVAIIFCAICKIDKDSINPTTTIVPYLLSYFIFLQELSRVSIYIHQRSGVVKPLPGERKCRPSLFAGPLKFFQNFRNLCSASKVLHGMA